MHRPSRARRILKWTGVAVSLTSMAAWILSGWWLALFILPGNRAYLSCTIGQFGVFTANYDVAVSGPGRFEYHGFKKFWMSLPETIISQRGARYVRGYSIPLWIMVAIVVIPTAWLWHRDRRRFGPGLCPKCGYDVRANSSGICSECGAKVQPVATAA